MKFTIFGSSGYIGSSLVKKLELERIECAKPNLQSDKITSENLGHVIYSVGVPNFKENPQKAIDAHVILLNKILKEANFESFLYLSSTRVYHNASSTNEESSLIVNPLNFEHIYNISKIMGEIMCNISTKKHVRIARLSNVTGKNLNQNVFLSSIIKNAIETKKITLQTSLDSEKDYVHVDDVIEILLKIAQKGENKVYNIASGKNLSNNQIVKKIQETTECKVEVIKKAKKYSFLPIDINRIKNEFDFEPRSILDEIEPIINSFRNK